MNTLGIFGLLFGGLAAFGGLLVAWIRKSSHDQGVQEERNAETQRSTQALGRANEVLAERRDPDDVVERLRKHDF